MNSARRCLPLAALGCVAGSLVALPWLRGPGRVQGQGEVAAVGESMTAPGTGRIAVSMRMSVLCLVFAAGVSVSTVVAAWEPATVSSPPSLAAVDWSLLGALRASTEAERKAALQVAQAALDALQVEAEPAAITGPTGVENSGTRWLARTERSLDRLQERTRRELRASLMDKIWVSPYGGIPPRDLGFLEQIADALRLLRALNEQGGGDTQASTGLQETYWAWLLAHRTRTGLETTALYEAPGAPVFDQRVVLKEDGQVQIYQLTGNAERVLRWQQVQWQSIPEDLLASRALTVALSRETARWLLVLEGSELPELLSAHRNWFESIEPQVQLVLRVRVDDARALAPVWFTPGRRAPSVLPVTGVETPGQLWLIGTGSGQVLGRWPMGNFEGAGVVELKALINRILSLQQRPARVG